MSKIVFFTIIIFLATTSRVLAEGKSPRVKRYVITPDKILCVRVLGKGEAKKWKAKDAQNVLDSFLISNDKMLIFYICK